MPAPLPAAPRGRSAAGPVAQWLEPAAHNGLVAGSSPAGPTTLRPSGYAATRRSKGEACPAELERSESEAGLAGLLRTECEASDACRAEANGEGGPSSPQATARRSRLR